ncbi:MAG: replication factor C large subunit [Candidatus Odinarchaeia archaeon]
MSITTLWTEKYRPKKISEIAANKSEVQEIINWVKNWFDKPPKKRGLLLYGPPGVGKTASIYAIANELSLEVLEINASDKRNAEEIKKIVGMASEQRSLLSTKIRIILIDEVDGVAGREDRGGISEIIKILKKTANPIIMTANDPWNPKLRSLREQCQLIRFKRIRTPSISKVLKKIAELEGIEIEEEAVKKIAINANGDLRSAINDLQFYSEGLTKITEKDIFYIGPRDRTQEIFEILKKVFQAEKIIDAKNTYDSIDIDYDLFFKWISENAYLHAKDSLELSDVYEILALADIQLSRIIKTNNWGLFKYFIFLITGGVSASISNKYGWKKYHFPTWINKLSKTKSKRGIIKELSKKIKLKCHLSITRAKSEIIPYLKIIFQNDLERAKELSRYFTLSDAEIEYLAGNKKVAKKIKA